MSACSPCSFLIPGCLAVRGCKIPQAWDRPLPTLPSPHRVLGPARNTASQEWAMDDSLVPHSPAWERGLPGPQLCPPRAEAQWEMGPTGPECCRVTSSNSAVSTNSLGTHRGPFPGSGFCRLLPQASPFPSAAPCPLPSESRSPGLSVTTTTNQLVSVSEFPLTSPEVGARGH